MDRVATLRSQLGSMNPMARSKGDSEPSYLEERLTKETQSVEGCDSGAPEEVAVSAKRSAASRKSSDKPPAYVEEDGVGHCKDRESPCESHSAPHICIKWSCENLDAAAQGNEFGKTT